ncbi:isoaspartyl peptidase/L-asparaginase [Anabaena sp. FACHB-1237]|uniref:isoaspartyl peptidase/L-asparaginase n=1 Tax=Anabaena sp. FACHB-1237 TaxID=2692769 RepID=UPI0016818097|nr:isoaspartyl peptidase/L-asparaginase [Anabaena sp. FACHB-1237]MBD2137571.1 isoaspartyl peptidase/L-asparaginase [Anabaena sp. FACHB-1237]
MKLEIKPKLIIHGGAGSSLQGKGGLIAVRNALRKIVDSVYSQLLMGINATEAVVKGCQMLEDEPRFNAGTGSVLQSDGQIRMSAAIMDGNMGRFSGVINVSRIKNPITMAQFLQTSSDRVLSDYGAAELARELQFPIYNPLTDLRLQEWIAERQDNFQKTMAGVVAEPEMAEAGSAGRGTIGVVVLDGYGKLAVGTSTGGKGFERIGRVSDSAMPAGNYANKFAAVSCTGIGEDIIDECLAAKVVVRVTDGMTLATAMEKSFIEANNNHRDFGAIAIDSNGNISYGKTCEVLLSAYHDGNNIGDTLEWHNQELTGNR